MSNCCNGNHEHHNTLHHVHHPENVEQRLLEAEKFCEETGAKLTALRKEVLQLILKASKPMGAYDLLANLKNRSDRPAAPPTVYRSLDFLLEQGLIHRLSSINAFIPCCHPREGHQAAFFICNQCHSVKEAPALGVLNELNHITENDDFKVQSSIIEISGLCKQCQG